MADRLVDLGISAPGGGRADETGSGEGLEDRAAGADDTGTDDRADRPGTGSERSPRSTTTDRNDDEAAEDGDAAARTDDSSADDTPTAQDGAAGERFEDPPGSTRGDGNGASSGTDGEAGGSQEPTGEHTQQTWEQHAQQLADALAASGADDAAAKRLADRLAAAGFPPSDTGATGSASGDQQRRAAPDAAPDDRSTEDGAGTFTREGDGDEAAEYTPSASDAANRDEPTGRSAGEGDEPKPTDTTAEPATGPGGSAADDAWDALAACASGGDWSARTGDGYYGGLQLTRATWLAYGGDQFATTADQATREQQIVVAERIRDDRGSYDAWPGCAANLGLLSAHD